MPEAQVSTVFVVPVLVVVSSCGSANFGVGRPNSVTGQLSKLGEVVCHVKVPIPRLKHVLLCLANQPPCNPRIGCDVIDKPPAAIAQVEDCRPCAPTPRAPRWVVLAHMCKIA